MTNPAAVRDPSGGDLVGAIAGWPHPALMARCRSATGDVAGALAAYGQIPDGTFEALRDAL